MYLSECPLFKAEGTYEWKSITLNQDRTDGRVVVLVSEPHQEPWGTPCTLVLFGIQQGKPNHRRKKERMEMLTISALFLAIKRN